MDLGAEVSLKSGERAADIAQPVIGVASLVIPVPLAHDHGWGQVADRPGYQDAKRLCSARSCCLPGQAKERRRQHEGGKEDRHGDGPTDVHPTVLQPV